MLTLVFGVLLLCSCLSMAVPAANAYDIDEPYTYPIVPGTPEWAALDNRITKGEVCQIPEDILSRMTTAALLETVLDYPLLGDIYAWNSPEQGFSMLLNSFNGLSELVDRPDFAQVLESFDLEETVIADSTVSYKMTTAEMGLERLVDYAVASPYVTLSSEQSSVCDSFSGAYSTSAITSVTLYTPAGSQVTALSNMTFSYLGVTEDDIERKEELWSTLYPNAIKLADANPLYNCHSYALHGLGSANNYYITNPAPYYLDGSFINVLSSNTYFPHFVYFYDHTNTMSNTVGSYYIHSMVRVNATTYKSKWGPYGLYQHGLFDNPYYIIEDTDPDDYVDDSSGPHCVKYYVLNPDYSDY